MTFVRAGERRLNLEYCIEAIDLPDGGIEVVMTFGAARRFHGEDAARVRSCLDAHEWDAADRPARTGPVISDAGPRPGAGTRTPG